jgi:hypothetical protein
MDRIEARWTTPPGPLFSALRGVIEKKLIRFLFQGLSRERFGICFGSAFQIYFSDSGNSGKEMNTI